MDEICPYLESWFHQLHAYSSDQSPTDKMKYNIRLTCELLMWVVGILGNLLNLVVFRHKNMARQTINSIFWWLSISDLLELVILALYQWHVSWSGWLDIIDHGSITSTSDPSNVHQFIVGRIYMYLFAVVHATTICLNIVLVIRQYMVVAYPLRNQKNTFKNQAIKITVICIYILSFVSFLPLWYIYKLEHLSDTWWMYGLRKDPLTRVFILTCGIVLRIGPLIILIISSILLLFAIKKAQRTRRSLGMQACHLSEGQRQVNRMNVTIILLIIMFLITEVPLGMSSFLILAHNYNCRITIDHFFLFPFILLNCCYSIFCYLLRIKQYRETLKLLLSKSGWVSSMDPITEQTCLELHSLQTTS